MPLRKKKKPKTKRHIVKKPKQRYFYIPFFSQNEK
jgi:hypothetical protein